MRRSPFFALILSSLVLSLAKAGAADPVSLERTLVRAAPDLLKVCRERGYQNVGVLKFLVAKAGQDKFTDNAGTLNRSVARQLELALILADPAARPIGIIDDASEVAAKTPGANHLTKEGRLKLFEPKYPLAWGSEKVTADAFITGVVGVEADLKTMKVKIFVFDGRQNTLEPLGPDLIALNDTRKLTEMSESFSTRGAFDSGNVETKANEAETIEKATKVKEKALPNPAQDASAPVKLEILYDGRPVPIEIRDGKAYVPEPAEGQKVAMHLKSNAPQITLACVLKVNGENTLFRQKLPDLHCRKWLLTPESKSGVQVAGFQKDNDTSEQFKVLSARESKAREINYGMDVGTITLTVFKEQKGRAPGGDLTDETQNTKVLEKLTPPAKKPDNFDALTAQLLDDSKRGLIEAGSKVGSRITIVQFNPDPTPIMGLTITYYKK